MEKERNIVDEYLDKKIKESEEKGIAVIEEPKTKNRKGLAVSIIALILAGMTAIGCFIGLKKKKNQPEEIVPSISTSTIVSIDELGKEEEFPKKEENKQYGKTTGNIKKEDLVEKNGTVWKDQAAANKSEQIGKVQTDLQNGTLKVDKDGDVVEKEEDYIVQNEQGMVINQGSNESGIPDGYVYKPEHDKIVKVEDSQKMERYVTIDTTYYDKTGNIVFEKGDVVTRESFEKIQYMLTTNPNQSYNPNYQYPTYENSYNSNYNEPIYNPNYQEPSYNEPTYEEPTYNNNTNYNGVINRDGTFTIDGVTFIDKATYEAIILGQYNEQDIRYNSNGVIYINQNQYQNVR